MNQNSRIHIGTSGWHYDHWLGPFYPEHLPRADFLAFYQQHFQTVEINNSFYRLPGEKTLRDWRDKVAEEFVFAVKGSRYITHMKKLQAAEQSLNLFCDRVKILGNRLGPILFQLPPRWKCNAERLREFLPRLPSKLRYTFEFRDQTWHNQEVYRLLAEHGAAFCIYEFGGAQSPREVTAAFVYIRLHGPGGPYQGSYDSRTLGDWAEAIAHWVVQGKEVFCYFDNDQAAYAAQNAMTLKGMLS